MSDAQQPTEAGRAAERVTSYPLQSPAEEASWDKAASASMADRSSRTSVSHHMVALGRAVDRAAATLAVLAAPRTPALTRSPTCHACRYDQANTASQDQT
jgi:hypothetical protein